ncbi:hypothetical protein SV7mr_52190 [Stieleria bergensis]|uniref:Uncharacterized protein n=1 Tax=Stieleria bergensis TaxID=2528025 RepID=A0A517T2R7_9BACT|nr:hypothetical protein SV7mr_52190 [Planctomycetes bacterium SV_7m_r]
MITGGGFVLGTAEFGDFSGHDFADHLPHLASQKVSKDTVGFCIAVDKALDERHRSLEQGRGWRGTPFFAHLGQVSNNNIHYSCYIYCAVNTSLSVNNQCLLNQIWRI